MVSSATQALYSRRIGKIFWDGLVITGSAQALGARDRQTKQYSGHGKAGAAGKVRWASKLSPLCVGRGYVK